jgi:hypothetical protein
MRLNESHIKLGILHPEEEVRLTAVQYFANVHSSDPSIMPLVIQSIERFGFDSAFRMLRDAEQLAQTAPTLEWLFEQLQRPFDTTNVADDNLRFAVGIIIARAPIDLLATRTTQLASRQNMPTPLQWAIDQRLQMASWDADACWNALETLGRQTMRQREVSRNDIRQADLIVEASARHADHLADRVLNLLQGRYPQKDRRLIEWLEGDMIKLAGRMKLAAAVPILLEYLHSPEAELADEATMALGCIGTDAVVDAIAEDWDDADDEFRLFATEVLEKVHSDRSVECGLKFLEHEEDLDIALALGHGLLSHFAFAGIETARELLRAEGEDLSPDHWDLRHHLLAAATIMEQDFTEYEEWYESAVEDHWGWGDYDSARLADAFR